MTALEVTVTVPVLLLPMPEAKVWPPPVIVLDVTVTVPVPVFEMPSAPPLVLPPAIVQEVTVTVPVLLLLMASQLPPTPPVSVQEVTVIAPVLLLLRPKLVDPLPPPVTVLAFVNATVPAADVDSIACAPSAVVVPVTRPPMATMPLRVRVPLDENAIARVERVNAEPVARHPASVELAAAETVKQFAEPAWMYAPVML